MDITVEKIIDNESNSMLTESTDNVNFYTPDPDIITNKDRKFISSTIKKLSESEHIEIFKIINNHTDKYTENKNGIFINLSKISDKVNRKIIDFINYCLNNKKILDIQNKERDYITELVNAKEIEDNESNNISENDSENDDIITDSTISTNINNIEKDILVSSLNMNNIDNNDKKIKYTGIRAKIIKKCKENSKYLSDDPNFEEL